jgi:hypothetical protein
MVVMVIGIAFVTSACGGAVDKISAEIAEKAIEASGEDGVDVEVSGEGDDLSVSIETEEGSLSIGGGSELPDELGIPVPDGGNVTTAGGQDSAVFAAVEFSQDRYDELVSFYENWTASDDEEWEASTATIDMGGETQRSAQWFAGSSLILVSDCFSISGEGDGGLNSACVTINEDR